VKAAKLRGIEMAAEQIALLLEAEENE